MSMELRDEASCVVRERRRIAGHYYRFQKKRLHWCDANLCRWSRERIEGLESRKQIAQCITHRLEDERRSKVLDAIKVLPGELSRPRNDTVVEPSLLDPP